MRLHEFLIRRDLFKSPDAPRERVWINLDQVTWVQPFGQGDDHTLISTGSSETGWIVEASLTKVLQLLERPFRDEHAGIRAMPATTLPNPGEGLKTGKRAK